MSDPTAARTEAKRTYHTLDALRGIAALAVVAYHYPQLFGRWTFPSAYLAVDFFFAMSGFVIAHAYDRRFVDGLTPGRFLVARIVRLYPLYALGTALSAAGIAGALLAGVPIAWTWRGLATALATGAAMLPSPPVPGKGLDLYPLNMPAWSIFYELAANFAYALAFPVLRGRMLIVAIALWGVALAVLAGLAGNLAGGVAWPEVASGVVRVGFSFLVGVALFRAHRDGRLPPIPLPPLVTAAILVALLAVDLAGPARAIYDAVFAMLVSPLLLVAAIGREPRRGIAACAMLGLVSYPVYMLHIPLQLYVLRVANMVAGDRIVALAPLTGIVVMAGLMVIVQFAVRCYDVPVRAWATPRFQPRRRQGVAHARPRRDMAQRAIRAVSISRRARP